MAKRPSFQFYPADWVSDSKLKRISHELKGIWIDVMCLLHDSDEYGLLRWPLEDIAKSVGCTKSKIQKLVSQGILRGVHRNQDSDEIIHKTKKKTIEIVMKSERGPVWYSRRMLLDEHIRQKRGKGGELSLNNENVPRPKDTLEDTPKDQLKGSLGVSPSSSSSSSSSPTGKEKSFPLQNIGQNNYSEDDENEQDHQTVWLTGFYFKWKTVCAAKIGLSTFLRNTSIMLMHENVTFELIDKVYMNPKWQQTTEVWHIEADLRKEAGIDQNPGEDIDWDYVFGRDKDSA